MAKSESKGKVRVILRKRDQKKLLRTHSLLFNSKAEAAESIGLSEGLYYRYTNLEIKSILKSAFLKVIEDIQINKDKWFFRVSVRKMQENLEYRKIGFEQYRKICGGDKKAHESLDLKRATYFNYKHGIIKKVPNKVLVEIAETIADFGNIFDKFGISSLQSLILKETSNIHIIELIKWGKKNPEEVLASRSTANKRAYLKLKEKYPNTWKKEKYNCLFKKSREKYGEDYKRIFGIMGGLHIKKEEIKRMEEKDCFSILEILEDTYAKDGLYTRQISRKIKERNSHYLRQRIKDLSSRGYVELKDYTNSNHLKVITKLTDRGRSLLWVYRKLKEGEERENSLEERV